jgi:hypothetical protein
MRKAILQEKLAELIFSEKIEKNNKTLFYS